MVMTLLTCGNELVSCGNDFANLWERLVLGRRRIILITINCLINLSKINQ